MLQDLIYCVGGYYEDPAVVHPCHTELKSNWSLNYWRIVVAVVVPSVRRYCTETIG